MGISHSKAYAAAGVDIEAGYQGVKMMNRYVQRTLTADVISDLGGFGGLFSLDLHGLEKPVLVSGTDGVGTKQRIAQLMDRHNTVGIDCVAMCVNDIICCGAKPLFFLDYIAIGKNIPEKVVSLVSGVSEGCVRAGCALIGGETAEHPGTMKPDDYDLAGFAVGVVGIDALALGAGFRCFDGKGYLRLEYAKLISVTITKQRRNLLCKVRAVIHHCEQSALDFEVGIDVLFDAVDGL